VPFKAEEFEYGEALAPREKRICGRGVLEHVEIEKRRTQLSF